VRARVKHMMLSYLSVHSILPVGEDLSLAATIYSLLDISLDVEATVRIVIVIEDDIGRFISTTSAIKRSTLICLVLESKGLAGLDGSEVREVALLVPEDDLLRAILVFAVRCGHEEVGVHL